MKSQSSKVFRLAGFGFERQRRDMVCDGLWDRGHAFLQLGGIVGPKFQEFIRST
jgi:hypothetical protein